MRLGDKVFLTRCGLVAVCLAAALSGCAKRELSRPQPSGGERGFSTRESAPNTGWAEASSGRVVGRDLVDEAASSGPGKGFAESETGKIDPAASPSPAAPESTPADKRFAPREKAFYAERFDATYTVGPFASADAAEEAAKKYAAKGFYPFVEEDGQGKFRLALGYNGAEEVAQYRLKTLGQSSPALLMRRGGGEPAKPAPKTPETAKAPAAKPAGTSTSKSESRPASSPDAKPAAPSDAMLWYNAGSYSSKENVQALVKRLKEKGFAVETAESAQGGKTWTRVKAGGRGSEAELLKALASVGVTSPIKVR